MKTEVNLHCSQQEFYDYLIQSLIIDIFKHTDNFYLKENLHPGFIYQKKIKDKNGKLFDANVEIIELNEPNLYKSKVMIGSNTNTISYELFQQDFLKISYIEEMSSSKKLFDLNYKVMSFILKRSYQKKMKRMLMMMDEHIKRSKE